MLSKHKKFFQLAGVIALAVTFAGFSFAASTTVAANAVIYAAGSQSALAATAGGSVPGAISIASGATTVTFQSVTGSITSGCASPHGCITVNTGTNLNDSYGTGAQVTTSSNGGSGSLSGITTAPGAGSLFGVFIATGGPSGSAPPALSFTSPINASYSPVLDQTFFIGDGTTGDGTGATVTYNVPAGASLLYLGISDSCTYTGGPGCYGDDFGTYTVSYTVNTTVVPTTPVPPSILLTLLGLACGALFLGYKGLHFGGQKA
jgi:hypothetical protein